MHRQSSRPARGALTGLAAAVILASACEPNNSVKPGAPVVTEVAIIENGSTATVISAGVGDCPAGTADGSDCDPMMTAMCRYTTASNWCRCVPNTPPPPPPVCTDAGAPDGGTDGGVNGGDEAGADAPAPPKGSWNCAPFAPNSAVLYTFDRLLYTATLDPGDAGGRTDLATTMFTPATGATFSTSTDYSPNGSPNEVIFPLFGDLRTDGPSLLVTLLTDGPELPSASTITTVLDKTKVLAKDGKTPFSAGAPFVDGSFTFTTAPFSVAFTSMPTPMPSTDPCVPSPTDVTPDSTPVVATFNNTVDPTMIPAHVAVTATPVSGGGATTAVAVDVTSTDGVNFNIVPTAMGNWPASSTIEVTIDAAAADLLGETLGAPVSTSFTTSAM